MSECVRTFLDLSTGHLMFHTRERMEDGEFPSLAMTGEYGWFCYVDADSIEEIAGLWDQDMKDCMTLAVKLGVAYIMFDQDAPRHDDLPYYED